MRVAQIAHVEHQVGVARQAARETETQYVEHRLAVARLAEPLADFLLPIIAAVVGRVDRSDARLVGTGWVSTCRSRWWTVHEKKKHTNKSQTYTTNLLSYY